MKKNTQEELELMKRLWAKNDLYMTCEDILHDFPIVYELYDRSQGENRDALFVKELFDIMLPMSAIIKVFARDKTIEPYYVLEKISMIENNMHSQRAFWEQRLEERIEEEKRRRKEDNGNN